MRLIFFFLASALAKKKKKQVILPEEQPICCSNPEAVCPRGFNPHSETECYKHYDSVLEYGCIVGEYDKEKHLCVTDHARPACLTCPEGYELHGTVCHAPLLSCPSVPVAPSIFATPDCSPDEESDAFHGVCKFKQYHQPVAKCAGEIINLCNTPICRVTIYKKKKIVCKMVDSIVDEPYQLDYISQLINDDFSQQL